MNTAIAAVTRATSLSAILLGMALLLPLASCADGGVGGASGSDVVGPEVTGDTGLVDMPDTKDAEVSVVEVVDSDATPDGDADATEDVAPTVCPGSAFCDCEKNTDCFSGWCVPGKDGLECTKLCDTNCPAGYSCRPVNNSQGNPEFICLYDHVFYCWPCEVSGDCAPALVEDSPHRCLPAADPAAGSFCATACGETADCPPGAACVKDAEGGTGHCQPQVGECACSNPAVNAGASTACARENEEGRCEGSRMCRAEGLSSCSAAVPGAETCNGKDDDCDGNTDEAFPEAGQDCDGQDADKCNDGQFVCKGGVLECTDDDGATVELCNEQDDDCDGATDEAFPKLNTACDGEDVDLCADGIWGCDAFGGLECSDDIAPVLETCDDLDEDCDGLTDESFVDKGKACDGPADADTCEDGKWVCGPAGGLVCDDAEGEQAEVCNAIDDDCDGATDEGFDTLGQLCDGDDEDQCPDGAWVCGTDGGVVCSDDASSGEELCNNLDDDCDGATDEAFPLKGAPCDGTDGDQCPDGAWVCGEDGGLQCEDDAASVADVCNGLDDDCDGATDETFPQLGTVCDGVDADDCAGGTWVCDGQVAVCNDSPGDSDDVCNDLDDDCDGLTDEDYPTKGQACDGEDADACADGSWICVGGELGCSDDAEATAELCNGEDDDCDGSNDEDFPDKGSLCDGEDDDLCLDGTWVCDGTDLLCSDGLSGVVELCNGEDDDCDGMTDEGFEEVGEDCDGADADKCADGVWICAGASVVCDDDGSSVAEICNDADDDCDGSTDESFTQKGAPCDGGDADSCEDGQLVCDGTGLVCQDDAGTSDEVCNGVDDDCDGKTDEAFPNKGAPCDGGDADKCLDGKLVCDGTGLVCDDDAEAITEACNDADDDCDGKFDEAFPNKGTFCDGEDADLCADGLWQCNGIVLVCTDDSASKAELCNGQNDDCDGAVDEGFEDKGKPCDGGDSDLCTDGVWACDGTGLFCTDDTSGKTETCNTVDDDCDGTTDEGFPSLGAPCDGGDADGCKDGVFVCDATSGLVCSDDAASVQELCNGVDDDCDNKTDEAFPTKGDPCDGPDDDACKEGQLVCNGGQTGLVCNDNTPTSVESCNGIDDDCDQQTDEGVTRACSSTCGGGTEFCTLGAWGGCTAPQPKSCYDYGSCSNQSSCAATCPSAPTEVCNLVDDNCNGTTDEGFYGDSSNGGLDFPNLWSVSIPLMASYPSTKAGVIKGKLLPEGDNDWWTIFATEDSFDFCLFGDDDPIVASITFTSPGNNELGQTTYYEVCACWSSDTTFCGEQEGADVPVCATSVGGAPVVLNVVQEESCDLLEDDQGYLDVQIRPDLSSIDRACSEYTFTWSISE